MSGQKIEVPAQTMFVDGKLVTVAGATIEVQHSDTIMCNGQPVAYITFSMYVRFKNWIKKLLHRN